jgi:hypothetical protein
MYDAEANSKAGLHDPTGEAQFEVFTADQYPDLKLAPGWWWDLPACRNDTSTTPRIGGAYQYANGPFETSAQAFEHAMKDDGDLTN